MDGGRRPNSLAVASGPRTHAVMDSLARGTDSYAAIGKEHGISKAAVGKIYRVRRRHNTDRWPVLDEDDQPAQGLTIEGCRYCGAWRRWRTAGDGLRYVTDWNGADKPPPTPRPADLSDALALRR